jgi:hypothetical protein
MLAAPLAFAMFLSMQQE